MIVKVNAKEGVPSPKSKQEAALFILQKKQTEQSQRQCDGADNNVEHSDPAEIIRWAEEEGWDEAPAELLTEEACDPNAVDDVRRARQDTQNGHDINLGLAECFEERSAAEDCSQPAADDEESRDKFYVNGEAAEQPRDDGESPALAPAPLP